MGFKTFTLEVQTTQKCNLGCPYCYVANKDIHMTPEIFDDNFEKIIKMMQASKTTELHVSFFGGEPMINFDIIKHVTKRIRALPIDTHLNIITNMTMIDEEKSKWLLENNLGVSWSFDGMGSNESRPLLPMLENHNKDGELYDGILDLYNDKKELILKHTRNCKVMIWSGNMHQMVENFDFFVDWGIGTADYSLVRDDVWTKDDLIAFKGHIQDLADRYIKAIIDGVDIHIGLFDLAIADGVFGLTIGKRDFGCFAGVHGANMTPTGDFYPCARFASKSLMKIEDDYDFQYWGEQFKPANYDKCKTCDIVEVCNAGCTFSQIRNDNKPVDSVCELFHMVNEQAFRIVHELRDNPLFQKQIVTLFKNLG